MGKRKFTRFKAESGTLAKLDLTEDKITIIGLVSDEALKGFSAIFIQGELPLERLLLPNKKCYGTVGNLAPETYEIRWVKPIDEGIFLVGFELIGFELKK